MKEFPKLIGEQVVLLRVDINTGIVLDDNYNYSINPNDRVYIVFANKDEALKIAKTIVLERNNVECGLYDLNQKMIFNVTINNVDRL
ncbi:hypothetical protein DBR11_26730 [Pedobacter sp. HMWF019]|uniref:hypothetical protein n=1 Tax=Pedobacter sp. HMWF019 TaxID=2056856 RepID=UPI000D34A30D|nr:hypothetical protein [Pedobacter sp. HMWF019]PTS92526.1 hypothetical protein DBR11_26730 [Pedobacter sp. HMWF019]